MHEAMARAGPKMMEIDPDLVAWYLTDFGGEPSDWDPVRLLGLARSRQQAGDADRALKLYRVLIRDFGQAPSVEMALYKMAECYWTAHHDAEKAKQCIAEMRRRFPGGPMATYADALLRQIERGGTH